MFNTLWPTEIPVYEVFKTLLSFRGFFCSFLFWPGLLHSGICFCAASALLTGPRGYYLPWQAGTFFNGCRKKRQAQQEQQDDEEGEEAAAAKGDALKWRIHTLAFFVRVFKRVHRWWATATWRRCWWRWCKCCYPDILQDAVCQFGQSGFSVAWARKMDAARRTKGGTVGDGAGKLHLCGILIT